MKQFPDEFITQVKEANPILEVAEEYFTLTKTGSIYQASCIHGDRNTKSLTFFDDTNSFYCFGCGAGKVEVTGGSDIINFVMWMDNCGFPEAVMKLANRKAMPIPTKELSKEDKKRYKLLQQSLEDNRIYWQNLQSQPHVLKYLANRGIGQEEIDIWRIGFVEHDDISKVAGRLVFPIINDWGQTVAFSFRNMSDQFPDIKDEGPKYINSPQSLIFTKGNILYGLHQIKRLIRDKNYLVIGEGFGDTITAQRYGLPFVSIMGTSLTQKHIEIIRKYTQNVYVWMDGDPGGISAALRHLEPLRKEGLLVKVIHTPGCDPDDVIMSQQGDLESFIFEQARLAGQFEIDLEMNKYRSDDMELKLKFIQRVKPILLSLDHKIEAELYAQQVAVELGIRAETLLEGVGIHGQDAGIAENPKQDEGLAGPGSH